MHRRCRRLSLTPQKSKSHHEIIMRRRSFHSPPHSEPYTALIESSTQNRDLKSGKSLHAHLIINGLNRLTHFATKLISLYAGCGQFSDARHLFDKIPQTNLRRWIALIGAYSRRGHHREAMSVFSEMQTHCRRPNRFILPSVLKSSGHLSDQKTGQKLHAVIIKHRFESDPFIASSLIDMYSKCRQIDTAKRVFDRMIDKDLVVLNSMVSGYVHNGLLSVAFDLVKNTESIITGIKPNVVTWNTLIAGFSQSGDQTVVAKIFRHMQIEGIKPDTVTWTSVISGLVQNFQTGRAFRTFKQMLNLGYIPTSTTIACLLPCCSNTTNSRLGKEIHGYAITIGVERDVYVKTALVDMYAKCGFIHEAKSLFENMSEKNKVTYNSMIFGLSNHGYCRESIDLFARMEKENQNPDHLTFTSVLTACSHGGLIETGQHLFWTMQEEYKIQPRLEHYACMVDLLGKAGKIDEAYRLIQTMPVNPDRFVWGALLGACRQYGNIELAEIAAKKISDLEPESGGSNLLMSNLYADAGIWENAAREKRTMKKRRLNKIPGCSWVDTS